MASFTKVYITPSFNLKYKKHKNPFAVCGLNLDSAGFDVVGLL